jgi:tetratricopeptide (TPR) repeat protein
MGATLDALGSDRPLLLVLDDLHWAEQPAVRLIVHLAGRPEGAPRLVLATYRDTDVDARHPLAAGLADLYRELAVEHVALEGLEPDGVKAMLERWTGRDRADPDAVRALREQTGGNPFFIEELLRAGVGESGDGGRPGRSPAAGVTQAVARRVSALGAEAHAVLVAGAIAGPEFELAVVAEVLGLPEGAALDVLDAAVRARLVTEAPGEPGRYAFAHALVRDALTGPLTAARRARLHDLIAAALEARARDDPDRYLVPLANHALEAAAGGGDAERAAELAERVAARAGAVLAYEDAAELLRRAISVLERRGGSADRRAELLCSLGEALQRAGAGEPARAALARASELARTTGRAELLARAALGAGGVGVTILGVDSQLVGRLAEALEAVGARGDAGLRVRLLARLAIELAYDPDPDRRERESREALDLARRLGDPAALAAALGARHVALWAPDHTPQRLDLATEMLEVARRAGDRELALQARNWRVVDLLEAGDGPGVRAELDAYAALSAEVRLPAYAWYVPMWRATLALIEGRTAEGLELSRRAHELGRRAGDANADVFFAEHQFVKMVVEDRLDELGPAASGIEAAVAERAERSPAWRAYRLTFAWVHAERGDLREARRDLDAALEGGVAAVPRDVNWLGAMCSAASACVLLQDSGLARELRALLEPYADRMVISARGASHGGSAAYFVAQLAAACGEHEAAGRLYEEAALRDERAGAAAYVSRDLRRHGELLLSTGLPDRAEELFRRAAAGAPIVQRR